MPANGRLQRRKLGVQAAQSGLLIIQILQLVLHQLQRHRSNGDGTRDHLLQVAGIGADAGEYRSPDAVTLVVLISISYSKKGPKPELRPGGH